MLKINLLPVRQLKKRAKARNQLLSIILCLICFVIMIGLVGYYQTQKVSTLENTIADIEKEKKKYKPTLDKIKKMEATKKELERKTAVIEKLKADSSLTVRVIDEVANIVDTERMWLLSFSQQGGSLSLKGVALDNQTIAQFMDNLKLSPFVKSVDLTDSSLKKIAGRDLKSFSLRCSVSHPPKAEKKVAKAEK